MRERGSRLARAARGLARRTGPALKRAGPTLRGAGRKLRIGTRWFAQHRAARQWTINVLGALLLILGARTARDWIQPTLTPEMLFTSPVIGPEAVEVVEARAGAVGRIATYTGSVEPWEENVVYARVDGYVKTLNVYPGDLVRRGQVLATLETSKLEPQLDEAVAEATFWAAEFRRDSFLYSERVISGADYDRTRTRYAMAEAQADLLRTQVGYASIRALTDGRVAERQVYAGQYVGTGDPIVKVDQLDRVRIQFEVAEEHLASMEPGTRVFLRFLQLDQAAVLAAWPDRTVPLGGAGELAQTLGSSANQPQSEGAAGDTTIRAESPLRASQAARDTSPDSPRGGDAPPPTGHRTADHAVAVEAEVAVVFPAEDPATRTAIVEVRLPNPGLLRTNTYVVGDFLVDEAEGVRVPVRALTSMPGGRTVVFVLPPIVNEGAVEEREVAVGVRNREWAQILSGVEPGERVVYRGNRGLVDGQVVTVVNPQGE